jgi:signal transduction histidine kinase
MGKIRSKQNIAMGYCFIIFLSLFIMSFSIYSTNKTYGKYDLIIKKMLPIRVLSSEILISLINQQTAIRGYIITKDKTFLETYNLGNKEIELYNSSQYKLKDLILDVNINNQLSEQIRLIQNFFNQQIALVDKSKLSEAVSNLKEGIYLIDKFRELDKKIIKMIDLEINITHNKVVNTRIIQQSLMVSFGIVITLMTLIFIKYIWNNMNEEIMKKNEMNLELQKILAFQEEFIANISHELKTPLNVIFATVQLFDMYCKSGSLDERKESIIKYIDSIKQNSNRLYKLINNIVDISKIEAGFFELHLSNYNIVEVVEEIVMSITNFTDNKGLNIIFDTDIEEKIIACDPEKIERIILNLISNAIKFSDVGDEIFIDIKDKDEFVEISVKDNGIGIEEYHLNMIFDRFKQIDKSLSRNKEGTGIGLSLVKSIVELHGGSINVESDFGKGSKFTVILPSAKVIQENMFVGEMRNNGDSIKVELSDVLS